MLQAINGPKRKTASRFDLVWLFGAIALGRAPAINTVAPVRCSEIRQPGGNLATGRIGWMRMSGMRSGTCPSAVMAMGQVVGQFVTNGMDAPTR